MAGSKSEAENIYDEPGTSCARNLGSYQNLRGCVRLHEGAFVSKNRTFLSMRRK